MSSASSAARCPLSTRTCKADDEHNAIEAEIYHVRLHPAVEGSCDIRWHVPEKGRGSTYWTGRDGCLREPGNTEASRRFQNIQLGLFGKPDSQRAAMISKGMRVMTSVTMPF